MKKEREVKVAAKVVKTPAKVKKVVDIFCDICNAKVDTNKDYRYGSGGHNCQMCGRDVCRKEACRRVDVDYTSDCAGDLYCPICWDLKFNKYKERYEDIEREHEIALQTTEYLIKKESLAKKST